MLTEAVELGFGDLSSVHTAIAAQGAAFVPSNSLP